MPNHGAIFMRGFEISPATDPKEFEVDLSDLRHIIETTETYGHLKPFGEAAININYKLGGEQSGLTFNRTIIDGNGEQQIDIYGTFYVSFRCVELPIPADEITMYKRLFSLEECAKPVEERIKTIKEYFPNGVEGVVMSDPNNIPEADRKYITTASDTPSCTPSYTRPSTPKQTYVPHCPICGSPDIEKITLAQKAFGGFMFGLFSKTAKSQFKCNNCGAKF